LGDVEKRLNELCSLGLDFKIVILDNSSPNISTTDYDILISKFNLDISLIVNKHNIGAPANLIRSFEVSSTEWVWIISDDDPLDIRSCIKFLLSCFVVDEEISLINASGVGSTGKKVFSFDEFLGTVKTLTDILQPAYNIYRRQAVVKDLHRIYHFSSTMCPQVFAVRACMELGGCYFIGESVISNENYDAIHQQPQWSYLMGYAVFDIGTSSMALTHNSRIRLRKLIYEALPGPKVFCGSVVKLLTQGCDRKSVRDLLHFIFNKAPLNVKVICLLGLLLSFLPFKTLSRICLFIDNVSGRKIRVGNPY
jgi:hypothetical protein